MNEQGNNTKMVPVPQGIFNQMINVCVMAAGLSLAAWSVTIGFALGALIGGYGAAITLRLAALAIVLGLACIFASAPLVRWYRANSRAASLDKSRKP